jgi:uncharacterized protein (UPF0335 family)
MDGGTMKQTDADKAVISKIVSAAGEELRAFVERIERLDEERREIGGQMTEVYAEAKGRGYDVKAIRKIVAIRKRKPEDVAEEQAVLDIYLNALGMA